MIEAAPGAGPARERAGRDHRGQQRELEQWRLLRPVHAGFLSEAAQPLASYLSRN